MRNSNLLRLLKKHLGLTLTCMAIATYAANTALGSSKEHHTEDKWAKARWISKVSKSIRNNKVARGDEVFALLSKTKEEIIEAFMQDPSYADTILDFNLYFLGFKGAGDVRDFPQAIKSAQEAYNGEHFDRILALEGPLYPKLIETDIDPASADWTHAKQVDKAEIEQLLALAQSGSGSDQDLCRLAQQQEENSERSVKLGPILDLEIKSLKVSCFFQTPIDRPKVIAALQLKLETLDKRYEMAKSFVRSNSESSGSAMGYQELPATGPWVGQKSKVGKTFWNHLTNSSTNYNRKRSAYILDRFFCDDLTPLNVSSPDSHAEGAHASSPACQACHYKLDPMAGFFKDFGIQGQSFAKEDFLVFDDEASLMGQDKKDYMNSWKDEEGSKWNIGYIQSTTSPRYNFYGQDLDDLVGIIKKSKQGRVCLTKRLASYFLGEGQSLDGAWIESMSKEFTTAKNSSQALKNIIKSLTLSKTYSMSDADPNQCYDTVNQSGASGVPCQVASLVEANCATCHSNRWAAKGLDLTKWVDLGDQGSGFYHVKNHKQVKPKETFKLMIDRINSSDPSFRMPLGMHMSPNERAKLYRWLLKQLGESK